MTLFWYTYNRATLEIDYPCLLSHPAPFPFHGVPGGYLLGGMISSLNSPLRLALNMEGTESLMAASCVLRINAFLASLHLKNVR